MEGNVSGLEKRRLQEFLTGFRIINMKLKEVFKMLTVQGQAELELVDTMDPFSDVRCCLICIKSPFLKPLPTKL